MNSFHLQMHMSTTEIAQVQSYLYKLRSLTVAIEPADPEAEKVIKDIILRLLTAIKDYNVH